MVRTISRARLPAAGADGISDSLERSIHQPMPATLDSGYTIVAVVLALMSALSHADSPEETRTMSSHPQPVAPSWLPSGHYAFGPEPASLTIQRGNRSFNRGVKRGEAVLVTGDVPRFSLLTFVRARGTNAPDFAKLGDGRVRVEGENWAVWLDEETDTETTFLPAGTVWTSRVSRLPGVTFTLEVWLVEDWGLAARLHVRCLDGTQLPAFRARFVYGGVAVHGRTFTPTYFFRPVTDDPRGDTIAETDGVITLADPEVPYAAYLRTVPVLSLEEFEGRPSFALTLEHGDDLYQSLDLLVGQSGKGAEISSRVASLQIDDAVTESQDYFAGVLAPYDIVTPLPSIDEGFRHAVLNLEYVYSDPAWLEGVHWWAGYFPNHYQLSAATALGQYERAAKTLRFFGLEPDEHWRWHLCLDSDEVAGTRRYDKANLAAYYALNIVEYLDATGDVALFRDVWPSLARTFEQVWQTRDFDGNGLLSWQFGCNLFLYQADSLALPGDSASPTLMVAGMCKLLSSRASVVGLAQSAETLDQYAAKGLDAARSRLWDPELEVFRSHIDHQGIAHAPHYYTDLVFPTLYTDLPTQYQEGPLRYLERQWTLAGLDQQVRLMRVGDLKPSMFGNDNVMPVQMCEAARAWYRQGRTDLATRMLESVGLAGTVYTDAPGNFPERMSDTGRGEANYVFGPPTGAYLHSVVVGLFGLSLGDSGQTLMWSPGFPASWGRARLRLPYATAELLSDEQGDRRTRTYRVTCDTSRPLQFAAWLHGSEPVTVRLNGDKVPYALESQYGRSRLLLQGPSSLEHEVTITTIGADSGDDLPAPVEPAEPSQGAVLPAGIGAADALDIAAFANTSKMEIVTKWGDDASVQLRMESSVDTAAGPFELVRGPNRLAAVALGRSDRITGITSPVEFAPTLTIPVRRRASSVLLLYANESESRLTGAQVGLIRLCYADGSIDATPLVVGRNVDCLLAHYAAEPVAVPVALADAPWPSGHLDLLAVPSDPKRELHAIEIHVHAADFVFALAGIKILGRPCQDR